MNLKKHEIRFFNNYNPELPLYTPKYLRKKIGVYVYNRLYRDGHITHVACLKSNTPKKFVQVDDWVDLKQLQNRQQLTQNNIT